MEALQKTSKEFLQLIRIFPTKFNVDGQIRYFIKSGYGLEHLSEPFEYGGKFEGPFVRVRRKGSKYFQYMDLLGNVTSEETEVGHAFFNFVRDLIKDGINMQAIGNIPYHLFANDKFVVSIKDMFALRYVEVRSKEKRISRGKKLLLREEGEKIAKKLCDEKILYDIQQDELQ